MITLLLHVLLLLPFLCGGHRQLALENLALHQQLAVYKRSVTRPKLRTTDRLLFSEAASQDVGHAGERGYSPARHVNVLRRSAYLTGRFSGVDDTDHTEASGWSPLRDHTCGR
jgi:hypothetical protein